MKERIYERFGAHIVRNNGVLGTCFCVWAPNAVEVSVVGDFNGWNKMANPMDKAENGVYEVFVPNAKVGDKYKYLITTWDYREIYKADPVGFESELRPDTASIIADIEDFSWQDEGWLLAKENENHLESPMFIYEVHLGSWRKKVENDGNGFYGYRELAPVLCGYVKDMGYTHIEIIGLLEHPFDGSWGYQVTGYYAPTKRYGSPKDFMYFVDYMHKNGIGVILDWVPAHFPKDEHGLMEFDGRALYEYEDRRMSEHPQWGTKVFDYGREEVRDFLVDSALFWILKYHLDGIRVDAVASMLYLDYGRENGEWQPNIYGENTNLEAVEFLKKLNKTVNDKCKRAIVIAEESTAWPKVSGDVNNKESLGFTYKWNMGWMHDFLSYMKLDPIYRKYNHNLMTFGLMYAYSERFILVLSHDEVVHLKRSMLNKMPGSYEDKFANLKLAYAFMVGHPGKKLLFMGQDFGQLKEWDESKSLEWYLLNEDYHSELHNFMKDLIGFYREHKALYEADIYQSGFLWIDADDCDRSIFSFIRRSKDKSKELIFVLNFTPVKRTDYEVKLGYDGEYELIFDENGYNNTIYMTDNGSIKLDLSGFGIRIFEKMH